MVGGRQAPLENLPLAKSGFLFMPKLKKETSEIWQEPDWEFLDFASKVEKEWCEKLRQNLPKTETAWLEIFPEAKKIIPAKIKEWEQKAETARLLVKEALRLIEKKLAEENRWFWREVIKYTFPPVSELAEAKKHIKRLKWAIPNKNKSKAAIWERTLERAREVDIVRVVEAYGLQLKKSGERYFALCPQHNEHTSSFCIYPPARYHCFGCQINGDQISFVQIMENCSFKEAVDRLQNF